MKLFCQSLNTMTSEIHQLIRVALKLKTGIIETNINRADKLSRSMDLTGFLDATRGFPELAQHFIVDLEMLRCSSLIDALDSEEEPDQFA